MDNESRQLDKNIVDFYQRTPEENRLQHGAFQLEAIRTRELIAQSAPPPPATVLDIGGGAGAYALWLADRGYTVHLLDAAPRLVEEARRRSAGAARPLASCAVGDARATTFADSAADIVLLLGPLYHLITAAERGRALAEAARVLRPGGLLFAAAISRWASALDGLTRDLFQDPQFVAIVETDIANGQHRNPTSKLDYFTAAFFHRPEEFRLEILSAGFVIDGVFGLEGPGWLLPDINERLDDVRQREDLLRIARVFEAEPSVIGVSAHLLAVARKPPHTEC